MSMILSLWARNEIWCEAGAGGAVQRGLAVQGFCSCDFHRPGLLQYITIPSPLLLDSQTGIVKHGYLVEWPSLSPSPAACDLRYTLLPNDWIYFLIQTPVSGPQCHLCPKPLTPLHAARCLHKWVSAQLRLPASQCHQAARGQLQQRSQGRSSSEWRPYFPTSVGEDGEGEGTRGSGGLKEGEKHHSFGYELQLALWPPSPRLRYQNTEPSASYCRASGEHGVNIILLGSRIQTAIILYS